MDDQERFKALIAAIRNKRPRIVAEHILAHGSITTEELTNLYGYNHPPRAARDLRELGIPLETFKVKNTEGRTIAAYRFGDLSQIQLDQLAGRRSFSKQFKQSLMAEHGTRCAICQTPFEGRYLQIDHRVPYSILNDSNTEELLLQDYMLVCATCNRAKAWSCEHCPNQTAKSVEMCRSCYWASPQGYMHIATQAIRRLELVWLAGETQQYDELVRLAEQQELSLAEYIKYILRNFSDQ